MMCCSTAKYAYIYIYSVLFFLCCAASANAQVSISAKLDSTHIFLGDILKLHVTIQAPKNTKIITPRLRDSSAIEQIDSVRVTEKIADNSVLLTQTWLLTVLDSGSFALPPLPYAYVLPNGAADTVYTEEMMIDVHIKHVDTTQVRDIAPLMLEEMTWNDWLPWLLGFFVLCAILYGTVWWRNRTRIREIGGTAVAEIITPAHELAVRKLGVLASEQRWQNGDTKGYYSELSYILREYVENNYEVAALESTTDELVKILKNRTDVAVNLRINLEQLLKTADLVKFAKGETLPADNANNLDFAYAFINLTKPLEAETEADN